MHRTIAARRAKWKRRASVPVIKILTALLLATLIGCGQPATGPGHIEEYLSRLSRTLDLSIPDYQQLLRPPRYSDYAIEPTDIPASTVGLLDFLALSDCALQVNVGRRNSSLGRQASASQRLILDLEFLSLAPECITTLEAAGERDLAEQLIAIQREKTDQLPSRIYNAVLAGPEFRAAWQLPASLADYPVNTGGDVLDALAWFQAATAAWLSGDFGFDWQPLEQQLFHLRSGDQGALLLAAVHQARELERGTALLQARATLGPLCPTAQMTDMARTLDTVVIKFFTAPVQQWLASVNQRERELMTPTRSLESLLAAALPGAYHNWSKARDDLLARLRSTPKGHVAALQHLASSCVGSALNHGAET